jgi:integrase/recombinase XerD
MWGIPSMAIVEQEKRYEEKALRILEGDSSVRRFDEILRADQVTASTKCAYFWQLVRVKRAIPEFKGELGNVSEQDLLRALAKLADESKGTGFQLTVRTMKRFFKSLDRPELAAKLRVPPRKGRLPDILTDEELKTLIEHAGGPDGSLRNRLIVELLWESGCRVGELCNLKLKDIQFDEYSAILYLQGKTGQRRVRVFTSKPDLLEHINNHPFKNNPNDALLYSNEGPGGRYHRLTTRGIRQIINDLGKRVLNKRVYPHMFRHTRATQLSRYLTDRELKIFGGWKRTQMLEVYSHLSGRDVDDKILAMHGIKIGDDNSANPLNVRVCQNEDCKAENSPMSIYCRKCGQPLVGDTAASLLKDPNFIQRLVKDKEFIEAVKKALTSG